MKGLLKKLSVFSSEEEKVKYLLNNYSCNKIALLLIHSLENESAESKVKKIRISKADFEKHFNIIQPRTK